jgi:putative membrane protein insertion efficiency factor
LSVVSIAPEARGRERLAVWAILRALRVYKIVLSPLFRGSCRFVPSCSDYASEAVSMHGAAFGSWLAVKRLARCHPFCRAGYDPVPSSKQ